jgi:hypothetical protein
MDACIRDLAAVAPPLTTPAQRDRLALLFSGTQRTRRQANQGSNSTP